MPKKFKCPRCGSGVAEEVIVDATISNEVMGIEDGCEDLVYGACGECYDGYTDRYQCKGCGHVIPDIHCPGEMVEWLKNNGEETNV